MRAKVFCRSWEQQDMSWVSLNGKWQMTNCMQDGHELMYLYVDLQDLYSKATKPS